MPSQPHLKKLQSISTEAQSPLPAKGLSDFFLPAGPLGESLQELLVSRNGFFAFESSLRVFSIRPEEDPLDLFTWNSEDLWRAKYDGLADGLIFFAEDVFGGQFGIDTTGVFTFNPETGERELLATSLDGWAEAVLSDYEVLTGYTLSHRWQEKNGQLPVDRHLAPKTPFVLGGDYTLENIYPSNRVSSMRFRADVAVQIRDLPDGTPVTIQITD